MEKVIIIIIIYNDFLPPPRRGSQVKSDKTHTQSSRYTPQPIDTGHPSLIFSSGALSTVYPSPLQVITTRAREGGPNEVSSKIGSVKLIQLHMCHYRN